MYDFQQTFQSLIAGTLPKDTAEAFLFGLSEDGETADQLVMAATILRAKSIPVGPFPDAVDLCGTGGDAAGTVNVSTAAALIAAASGLPVAKHGNRAASSRSGSTDVLQALGIKVATNPRQADAQFQACGITFMSAPDFHPALAPLAPLRRRIGRRTIFNLLGPLLNPAGVQRQLVGVFAPDWLVPFAEALRQLGSNHAWVVHGDGLDELTVTDGSKVAAVSTDHISGFEVHPEELGLNIWQKTDIKGGSPEENASTMEAMLQGAPGAYHDIAALNAAAALVVGNQVKNLTQAIHITKNIIASGAALDLLHRLRHHKP